MSEYFLFHQNMSLNARSDVSFLDKLNWFLDRLNFKKIFLDAMPILPREITS